MAKIDQSNEMVENIPPFEEMSKEKQKDDPFQRPVSFVGRFVIRIIRFYQVAISPMIGPCCRFTPTCSQYFILAIKKYGLIYGSIKGVWRILRCHPFCKGGDDYP